MIDEKQPAELPPVGSCLICGHEKPFGVWKADVGVCGDCRDKARARVETLPWGHSPIEPIVTLQLERDQALKDADDLRSENRRLEAQAAAMREALGGFKVWWDSVYPKDIFTGESGDYGALEVVRLRELLEQAAPEAGKSPIEATLKETIP